MEQNMTAAMPEMGGSKQQGNGLKIATAIASVIAVCGIGFGVYGMVQSSQKDNQISDLKVQIKNEDGTVTTIETPKIETTTENGGTTVTITDSTITEEKQPIAELNGDIALDLLRKKAQTFGVAYANVYAKYNGTDRVAYWVKYYPTHVQSVEIMTANDIIFTLGDDGVWEFELPGFTGYGPDLLEQYTVLREE